jgi:hypothetical protein
VLLMFIYCWCKSVPWFLSCHLFYAVLSGQSFITHFFYCNMCSRQHVFLYVMLCSLVEIYQCFTGTCYLVRAALWIKLA